VDHLIHVELKISACFLLLLLLMMLVFQSRSCMSEGSGPRRPATAGEVPPAEGDIGKADTDKT
jgi:hypothetical protein